LSGYHIFHGIVIVSARRYQGCIHVSKIGGAHLSLLSPQMSNYSGQRSQGKSRLGSLGERCKLPQHGMGWTPAANDFEAFPVQFYVISRIF